MSPDSSRARRLGARLAAAAATGAVAAAALAAPAAAAVPGIDGDPLVNLGLSSTVTAGESAPGSITVDYTPAPGAEGTTHVVAAELAVTGSAGVVQLTSTDTACDDSTAYTVQCTDAEADANTAFGFDLGAVASAEDETFEYTLTVTIDGTEVATRTGTFAVASTYDVHNPYAHGNIAVTDVAGGAHIKVKPVFYQDFDLAPTAAAMVVSFTGSLPDDGIDPSGLATPVGAYSNCRTVDDAGDPDATGLECVIADVPDAKGQFLTLATAVNYKIASGVVGPLDVCSCTYSVETIDADTLAEEYGDLSWGGNGTLGLTTTAEGWDGAEESIAYYHGGITLTTKDNTYDLEVSETFIEGMVGDDVTVTTDIVNNGPAGGADLNPESDSYLVRGQLPEGTELVRVDSDGAGAWECRDADELDALHAATATALERFDFACAIDKFGFRGEPDLTYTVTLTDTSAYQGAIEIGAVYNDGEYEGDPSSDFALVYNEAYEARYDYDQDHYEDLFTIRKSDGALRLYTGTSSGKYANAVTVATGWGRFDIVMAGDLTGDGVPDLIARDNETGTLYTYPGDGEGGLDARITVGGGWGRMGQISVGHYDGDGVPDLFATAYSDGKLYYYPGLGDGEFGPREFVSEEWNGMDVITSTGDLDGDGYDEFISRWNYNGRYYVYSSQGETYELPQSLNTYAGYDSRFEQVVGLGDLTRDGKPDIGATDLETGQLVVRHINLDRITELNGNGIGSGWNGVRLPVTVLDRTYDYDYDGFSDAAAQRRSDGDLYLYWGTSGGLGSRWNMCDDCDGISAASSGGDYNSDGRTDLLYRTLAGELWIAPGLDNGEIGFTTGIQSGTGWNAMADITGGHDHNSDGRDDLFARHPGTGYLYFYPGRGDGTFGSRVKIGTGWNGMRDITTAGDLNHDGHADVLAVRSSNGCLYLYPGRGNGTLAGGAQVGCGWGGYDQITGIGDLDRDGHDDWLARRKSDGTLYLYQGDGNGGYGSRKQIGTGWNSMSYLA
jgi:hypothetical protein